MDEQQQAKPDWPKCPDCKTEKAWVLHEARNTFLCGRCWHEEYKKALANLYQ